MAIVSVNKLWTSRGGVDTFTRQRTYREQWEVITGDPGDDEEVVAGAAAAAMGLPRLGQPHVRYPVAVCVEIDAEQSDETPFRWLVSIRYDSNPPLPNGVDPDGESQSPADIPENPLLRPATWEVSFETTTEVAKHWYRIADDETTVNGDAPNALPPALALIAGAVAGITQGVRAAAPTPILNSAGLPFDPTLQVEVSRPVIRITKNVRSVSFPLLLRLQDALNRNPWRGLGPRCARIRGVRSSNKFENGVSFVELSLEIPIKYETWDVRILDAGGHVKQHRADPTTGALTEQWVELRDPFGATGVFPLNGHGQRLSPDKEPVFLRGVPTSYHLEDFRSLLNL